MLTVKEAKANHKPCLIIDLSKETSIDENNIKILNVAGPRESQSPGIYDLNFGFLEKIWQLLLWKGKCKF